MNCVQYTCTYAYNLHTVYNMWYAYGGHTKAKDLSTIYKHIHSYNILDIQRPQSENKLSELAFLPRQKQQQRSKPKLLLSIFYFIRAFHFIIIHLFTYLVNASQTINAEMIISKIYIFSTVSFVQKFIHSLVLILNFIY